LDFDDWWFGNQVPESGEQKSFFDQIEPPLYWNFRWSFANVDVNWNIVKLQSDYYKLDNFVDVPKDSQVHKMRTVDYFDKWDKQKVILPKNYEITDVNFVDEMWNEIPAKLNQDFAVYRTDEGLYEVEYLNDDLFRMNISVAKWNIESVIKGEQNLENYASGLSWKWEEVFTSQVPGNNYLIDTRAQEIETFIQNNSYYGFDTKVSKEIDSANKIKYSQNLLNSQSNYGGKMMMICNQSALLAVVLLNKSGIQARIVRGMTWGDKLWGPWHSWVEYRNGEKWIEMDPTPSLEPPEEVLKNMQEEFDQKMLKKTDILDESVDYDNDWVLDRRDFTLTSKWVSTKNDNFVVNKDQDSWNELLNKYVFVRRDIPKDYANWKYISVSDSKDNIPNLFLVDPRIFDSNSEVFSSKDLENMMYPITDFNAKLYEYFMLVGSTDDIDDSQASWQEKLSRYEQAFEMYFDYVVWEGEEWQYENTDRENLLNKIKNLRLKIIEQKKIEIQLASLLESLTKSDVDDYVNTLNQSYYAGFLTDPEFAKYESVAVWVSVDFQESDFWSIMDSIVKSQWFDIFSDEYKSSINIAEWKIKWVWGKNTWWFELEKDWKIVFINQLNLTTPTIDNFGVKHDESVGLAWYIADYEIQDGSSYKKTYDQFTPQNLSKYLLWDKKDFQENKEQEDFIRPELIEKLRWFSNQNRLDINEFTDLNQLEINYIFDVLSGDEILLDESGNELIFKKITSVRISWINCKKIPKIEKLSKLFVLELKWTFEWLEECKLPDSFRLLSLSSPKITKMPNIVNGSNLSELNLSYCSLKEMPDIDDKSPLSSLNLSNNKIEKLVKVNPNMKKLVLSNNNISSISPEFHNNGLVRLYLDNNKLQSFDSNWKDYYWLSLAFNPLESCKTEVQKNQFGWYLNLAYTNITTLEDVKFNSNADQINISWTKLSWDKILDVYKKQNTVILQDLNIGDQKFEELLAVKPPNNLFLWNNNITKIPNSLLDASIGILDLHNNSIKSIENMPRYIRKLVLSHNPLQLPIKDNGSWKVENLYYSNLEHKPEFMKNFDAGKILTLSQSILESDETRTPFDMDEILNIRDYLWIKPIMQD